MCVSAAVAMKSMRPAAQLRVNRLLQLGKSNAGKNRKTSKEAGRKSQSQSAIKVQKRARGTIGRGGVKRERDTRGC